MNKELSKVRKWCDANKLSINFKKTNFMIIKSAQKKLNTEVKIVIPNDGAYYTLEKKDHVKYLGVILEDKINWKYHVSYISSKISRNIGIFYKLRHYLSPAQLRQIYYNLIFPYLSYTIIAWGSSYKSNIEILQTKQNHIARVIFFSTLYGENTESALPLLNLLDILTVNNVYELQAINFLHDWHNQRLPPIFDNCIKYARDVHSYNTPYAASDNLYKARFKTNTGKQTLYVMATDSWEKLPPPPPPPPHRTKTRKNKHV